MAAGPACPTPLQIVALPSMMLRRPCAHPYTLPAREYTRALELTASVCAAAGPHGTLGEPANEAGASTNTANPQPAATSERLIASTVRLSAK